jgi:BirA family biotin operon repressor/biotin-[acetyl-CoA-carboxylase] ligase
MRAAGETGISGAALAKDLGVSRAAIWSRIEDLRKAGYDIEASPHHGYQLRSSPDRLHADDLLARLGPGKLIGRDIQVFQVTASTNDVVEKMARDSVREGIVVFAESQTRGRGRLGRQWISPSGKGLWFSVLPRPQLPPAAATQLTVVSAVAVARGIERHTGLKPEIKWPNDIVFGTRKVAGILLELGAELADDDVVLTVDDDGPGVPEELRQRIFEPFFTTRPDGNGLGLATCHQLVQRNGGVIGATRSPLGGARFTIRLPAVATDLSGA